MSPASPRRRPRIPSFVPVPVRARRDGWTLARQAQFIGGLAETGSVPAAAVRVGMSRESAWRLRARDGAESFAAAWDAAKAFGEGQPLPIAPKRKITPGEWRRRAFGGVVRVVMRRGRHAWTERKPDTCAILHWLAILDRSTCYWNGEER
jgi:hypothetical protein